MIPIGKKYGIDAVFALSKAEDVWKGIENVFYSKGLRLFAHHKKTYPFPQSKYVCQNVYEIVLEVSYIPHQPFFFCSSIDFKYLIQYHIIWCPKFRFSVLQGNVDITLKQILQKICDDYGYKIPLHRNRDIDLYII